MMKISGINIGDGNPCFIIAEIGSNQMRSLELSKKMIDMAADAGVDAVKFQTLKASDVSTMDTPANAYGDFDYTKGKNYWYEVLEDYVLPYEWHAELFDYANSKKLIAFSTPESKEALKLLEEIRCPLYKISSTNITYFPLLKEIAKTGKPIILSAGIANMEQLFRSINFLKENGAGDIALLHCISDYPPKEDDMMLEMISYYKRVFDFPIGLSNHSDVNLYDGVAVALGATIIEKHITLNKLSTGPDHHFALDKTGLNDLVKTVKSVERSLKINQKLKGKINLKKELYSRSITLNKSMKADQSISENDLDYRRPGTGISPMDYEKVIGLRVRKNLERNHLLDWSDFK